MGISIQPKTDYSSLFSSLGTSSMGNLNFLSDYASIKNGSYGKLMKAYYAKDGGDVSASTTKISKPKDTTVKSTEELAKVERSAEDLKVKADKMLELDTDDKDEYLKNLKDFASSYNSLIDSADATTNTSVLKKANTLVNLTQSNKDMLESVGVKIGEDLKLSVDEEAFGKADLGTAKNLFKGTGSYAYSVSAQATMIDYQANYESIKAGTYNQKGSFDTAAKGVGDLFESFF